MSRLTIRILAACATFVATTAPVFAQHLADFYKAHAVSFYVGSDAGAGYDAYARLLSRHIGKHIPGNPTIIVRNMPGAGSLTMANYIVKSAPKDGTTIAAPQSSVAVERLLHLLSKDGRAANFDAAKLNWLGSATQDTFVLLGSPAAKAKSIQDMTTTGFILGASGPNTDGSIVVAALNELLGTKIKLVTGYAGTGAQLLALERKEIDGAVMAYSTATTLRPKILTDGKIDILLQIGDRPHPDLKNVPLFADLLKNKDDKALISLLFAKYKMGRPYFLAPEVPRDRVAALRAAFDATLKDPDLLADAKKTHLEINPVSGPDVQSLVEQLNTAPEALVTRARKVLAANR